MKKVNLGILATVIALAASIAFVVDTVCELHKFNKIYNLDSEF